MNSYELSQITKAFGAHKVLDIENLTIEDRKIHAMLGPNGAGKTTLLHLLAFLESPTSGQVSFFGEPVRYLRSQLQSLRQEVVMVDQFPIMFTTSVWKNLEFGLKIRGISRDRRTVIIEESLEMVGMRKFAAAAAHRLSGGETQRVALARALALSPRVFLCDEPTSNVDVENQAVVVDILRRINAEKNITIIFATHDRSQAARLAHRILVLDHGRIAPATFENVFTCRILEREDAHIRLELGSQILRVPVSENFKWDSSKLRILIDAGKISVSDRQNATDAPNAFQGRVAALSTENQHIRVLADIGMDLNVLLPLAAYHQMPLTIGQEIAVLIPVEAIRLVE